MQPPINTQRLNKPQFQYVLLACICFLLLILGIPPISLAQSTPDCAPTRLEVWSQAEVPEGQVTNRLRNAPSLDGAIIGEIPVRVPIDILDGPICGDGILWWEVEARGEQGFTAEVAGDQYFMERINDDCMPSQLMPDGAAFLAELNDREVAMYSRPRLEATFEQTAVTRISTLYLSEQSVCAQDVYWWYADAADGTSGWVIETQQNVQNLTIAPRLERGDFGLIIEASTDAPPSLADYTLTYITEVDIPFSVNSRDVFLHPLDSEPERISDDAVTFRQRLHWSADGRQVAYEQVGHIVIVSIADGTQTTIALNGRIFKGWSPDGDYLLWNDYDDDNNEYDWGVLSVETEEFITLVRGDRHALGRWQDANTFELMNRTEDGSFVISSVTIDPPNVEEQQLPAWTRAIDNWDFAPDGRIAFEFDGQLAVFNPQNGNLQTIFNLERVDEYAWSPDGSRIAVIAGFDDIPYVIDVDSQQAIPLLPINSQIRASAPLRWSSDGVLLSYRQGNSSLVVQPADGSTLPTVVVVEYRGGVFPEDIRFQPTLE